SPPQGRRQERCEIRSPAQGRGSARLAAGPSSQGEGCKGDAVKGEDCDEGSPGCEAGQESEGRKGEEDEVGRRGSPRRQAHKDGKEGAAGPEAAHALIRAAIADTAPVQP